MSRWNPRFVARAHIPVDVTVDVAVDHRGWSRVGPGSGTLARSSLTDEGRSSSPKRRVGAQRSRVLSGGLDCMLVREGTACHIRQCGVRLPIKGASVMRHLGIADLKWVMIVSDSCQDIKNGEVQWRTNAQGFPRESNFPRHRKGAGRVKTY